MKLLALVCFGCGFLSAQTEKGVLSGTVVNAGDGQLLKKAQIELLRLGAQGPPRAARSDASGHFEFLSVEPGRYSVIASHPGFITSQYGAKGPDRAGTSITIDSGARRNDINFRLIPKGAISGRILDEDGDPMPGIAVQTMRYVYNRGHKQLQPAGGATTNDRGEYRIFDLNPAKYFVTAATRSSENTLFEEGYALTFYPNALTASGAAPVEVSPGADLRGMDITLTKTRLVRVRGRVVNSNNQPIQHASVSILSRDTNTSSISSRVLIQADPKGIFEFTRVIPGAYVLIADVNTDEIHLSGRTPVDVGPTHLDGIAITVEPSSSLAGRLTVEGKSQVNPSLISVYLEPKNAAVGGGAGGRTVADGTFQLMNIRPDTYDINVFGLRDNLYLKAAKLGDQDVTAGGLDFSLGVPAAVLSVVISASGAEVSGAVQDDKQNQVPGALVVLIPEPSKRSLTRLFHASTADANGSFSIKGVAPGEYKLFAWEQVEANAWQDPDFLKPFESHGETISVNENAHETKQLKVISVEESKAEH